jgi:hypothetical protein
MPIKHVLPALALAVCLLPALAGCDTAPGPSALDTRIPSVRDLELSPREAIFLEGQTSIDLPLSIRVRATDPDGDLHEVRYVVSSAAGVTIDEGLLASMGGAVFGVDRALTVTRGQAGIYTVLVTATDLRGQVGNQVRGQIDISGVSLGPPMIVSVEGPEEFRPPGQLRLIAVVSDPAGLENIARVDVRTPAGAVRQMFDDGQTGGDEVAGDGRYTATFDVPAASPGPQTFVFFARNRDGLRSEEVPFTITVLP